MDPIRVLIVDDSPFMRKALERMLTDAQDLQVVGIARNGEDALEKIEALHPDIVTLDVEMPRMDGLTCLRHIMERHPLPVLMVSSLTHDGATATLEALALGALDFIPKESSFSNQNILKIQNDLQEKIRKLANSPRFKPPASRHTPLVPAAITSRAPSTPVRAAGKDKLPATPMTQLIALGCSTGGPKALQELLPELPSNLSVPIMIVQHMPASFTKPFAERLNSLSQVRVKEAEHGEPILPGTVYISPGGIHLNYKKQGANAQVELNPEPSASLHRPSVDVMFQNLARECSLQIMAIILTGMGSDGARGMSTLKAKGAHTIAEAEESCVVYGMPRAAFERGCVDQVAPLPDIAGIIRRHLQL